MADRIRPGRFGVDRQRRPGDAGEPDGSTSASSGLTTHHRIDPASPWGGCKDSGIGSENGVELFRAYTRQQSLVINASNSEFDWFGTVEDLQYS